LQLRQQGQRPVGDDSNINISVVIVIIIHEQRRLVLVMDAPSLTTLRVRRVHPIVTALLGSHAVEGGENSTTNNNFVIGINNISNSNSNPSSLIFRGVKIGPSTTTCPGRGTIISF
jgi:hypothetical protein